MSMILDAIKRSREEQRDKSAMPNLDSEHFTAPRPRRRPAGALLLVSAIVIGGLSLAIVVLTTEQADPNAQSAIGTVPVQVAAVNDPMLRSRALGGEPPSDTIEADSASAPVARGSRVDDIALQNPELTASADAQVDAQTRGYGTVNPVAIATNGSLSSVAPQGQPSAATDPAIAALYSSTEAASTTGSLGQRDVGRTSAADAAAGYFESGMGGLAVQGQNTSTNVSAVREIAVPDNGEVTRLPPGEGELAEELIDIESVLERAQRALGESSLLPHPTPLIENLSQQTKDKIPSLFYTVHQYDNAGGASIVINGQRAQVGARVAGFTVKDILPDSAIVSWGGTDFRIRALNSWVNL